MSDGKGWDLFPWDENAVGCSFLCEGDLHIETKGKFLFLQISILQCNSKKDRIRVAIVRELCFSYGSFNFMNRNKKFFQVSLPYILYLIQ